jgi:hypothetical protein
MKAARSAKKAGRTANAAIISIANPPTQTLTPDSEAFLEM